MSKGHQNSQAEIPQQMAILMIPEHTYFNFLYLLNKSNILN